MTAVDISADAIEMTRRNAEQNGFTNVEFRQADVFDLLTELYRAGGRASGSAGEASICDERNVSVKTLTNDRRSRSQHLRHSGTALRTFVANYYNIACLDVAAEDSVARSLLAVEYARRTGEVHHLGLYCALLRRARFRQPEPLRRKNHSVRDPRKSCNGRNFRLRA